MKRLFLNQITTLSIYALVVLSTSIQSSMAQQQSEPLFEELQQNFKKKSFSFGLLIQSVADFQIERSFPGNNGFSMANFRLILSGELDGKFGYLARTNFVSGFSILDAKIYYKFSPRFILDIGQFKSPFSKEFLTGAESIDFVNRSRVVSILAPGRQIGLQARGKPLTDVPATYEFGIFNGNGTAANSNDNDQFLYVLRGNIFPLESLKSKEKLVEIGVNAAYSEDSSVRISEQLNPFIFEPSFFTGTRKLLGADFRLSYQRILLAGEYIWGNFQGTFLTLSRDTTFSARKSHGTHVTAGYMILSNLQLLGRFDRFKTNDNSEFPDWVVLGLNYWPTRATEFQMNYIVNTDKSQPKFHQILINIQLAF